MKFQIEFSREHYPPNERQRDYPFNPESKIDFQDSPPPLPVGRERVTEIVKRSTER